MYLVLAALPHSSMKFSPALALIFAFFFSSYASPRSIPGHAFKEASDNILDYVRHQKGLSLEQMKLGRVHSDEARIGHSLYYNFVLEINGQRMEFVLAGKVPKWNWIQETGGYGGSEHAPQSLYFEQELARDGFKEKALVLPEFELSGPAELWLENASDLKLSLPHPVDAGEIKKIILSEDTRVTVIGARGISLARPVKLALPLPKDSNVSEIDALSKAVKLEQVCQNLGASALSRSDEGGRPLLALRILEPDSLRSAPRSFESFKQKALSDVSDSAKASEKALARIKAKRISPFALELRSREKSLEVEEGTPWNGLGRENPSWPFPNLNFTEPKLVGIEQEITKLVGNSFNEQGSFQILSALVQTAYFVRFPLEIDFDLGNPLAILSGSDLAEDPKHEGDRNATTFREQYEITARLVSGAKLQPIKINKLDSAGGAITISPQLLSPGNETLLPWLGLVSGNVRLDFK